MYITLSIVHVYVHVHVHRSDYSIPDSLGTFMLSTVEMLCSLWSWNVITKRKCMYVNVSFINIYCQQDDLSVTEGWVP